YTVSWPAGDAVVMLLVGVAILVPVCRITCLRLSANGLSHAFLHPDGTEFIFRDFAVGVKGINRQQVGGRLLKVEGQKDAPTRRLMRAERFHRDLTTPRHHPHKLTIGNPERLHIFR